MLGRFNRMLCQIFTLTLLIFNHLKFVKGNPAVPTRWTPSNWNGQGGSGVGLRSIYEYRNLTQLARPTSGLNSACPLNCTREPIHGRIVEWSPKAITATITAATVIHIVNTKRNTTRYTTITNTEADLSNFTAPTDTNSLGTRTYMVTDVAPDGRGNTTYPIAFPTIYTKYDAQVRFRGALPTTVSGTPTCLRAMNETKSSFPVHPTIQATPFLPVESPKKGPYYEADLAYESRQNSQWEQDPKGWTWVPDRGDKVEVAETVEKLIPNLGVWNCEPILATMAAPATYLGTALYLTQTSTMSEGDDDVASAVGETQPTTTSATPAVASFAAQLAEYRFLWPAFGMAAKPAPTQDKVALLPSLLAALRVAASVPKATAVPEMAGNAGSEATPAPEMQSASIAEGLPRVGTPITAAPKVDGSPTSEGAPPIEIGRDTVTPNAQSQYVVSGQTLGVGSSITLGSGPSATVVGLQASGSQTELVVGSSTSILSPPVEPTTPPLTVGGQVYQANSQGQYIIGGQTLTPGSAIDVNGTPVSLAPGATQLVVGSSTENLDSQPPTGSDFGVGGPAETAFTGTAIVKTFSLSIMIAASGLTTALLLF